MAPVPRAIRHITNTSILEPAHLYPYGTNYDVLWLGHCGAHPEHPAPEVTFFDYTVLPSKQIRVWDHKPAFNIGEGNRQVRVGDSYVCSFAYAVGARGAKKLLGTMEGGGTAFDVELNNACKDTATCVGIIPELMHQAEFKGRMGLIDSVNKPSDGRVKSEEGELTTFNIPYSARCNADRSDTERIQCLP